MKSKSEKLAEAKKNAEAQKAKKKALRDSSKSAATSSGSANGKKGKSIVPQAKPKKK